MHQIYQILNGDCAEMLKTLPDCSVDAIVTDPPYGLSKQPDMAEVLRHWMNGDDYKHNGSGFMGKSWDSFVPGPSVWRECLRVLKPGGHMLAFFGSRTYDLGTLAIRLAGFEIRDQIMWVYGSGFPKSLDISKAIDKQAGVEREVVGDKLDRDGWGTALKPAHEPIVVARKPVEGTVADNVLKYGTGGININGSRVCSYDGTTTARKPAKVGLTSTPFGKGLNMGGNGSSIGRFPANFIHDGSDEVVGLFPVTTSGPAAKTRTKDGKNKGWGMNAQPNVPELYNGGDSGSAARFFYCAKASKKDREGSTHPTMKPTDLMRYLCRLVTPPNGVVLDPFTGSGSTGKAAILEGFRFIGIEREAEYVEIAKARIEAAVANTGQQAELFTL